MFAGPRWLCSQAATDSELLKKNCGQTAYPQRFSLPEQPEDLRYFCFIYSE
jgi:hypothetical protein